uniref:Uncharacterized protein n=1 Tax=Nelumbo nucifera TaxID=4432 RepID=A0A822Y9E7_NELNU|nr:TPA_asm: hypothetical protein HUJ06_030628 [Nelumbo nucifera]
MESNSLLSINILGGERKDVPWACLALVDDILSIVSALNHISFLFVNKSGNQAAHCIAQF